MQKSFVDAPEAVDKCRNLFVVLSKLKSSAKLESSLAGFVNFELQSNRARAVIGREDVSKSYTLKSFVSAFPDITDPYDCHGRC